MAKPKRGRKPSVTKASLGKTQLATLVLEVVHYPPTRTDSAELRHIKDEIKKMVPKMSPLKEAFILPKKNHHGIKNWMKKEFPKHTFRFYVIPDNKDYVRVWKKS